MLRILTVGYIGRWMVSAYRTSSTILWMRLVGHLILCRWRNWDSTSTVLKKDLPSVRIAQVMHLHTSGVKDSWMMWTSWRSSVSAISSMPL